MAAHNLHASNANLHGLPGESIVAGNVVGIVKDDEVFARAVNKALPDDVRAHRRAIHAIELDLGERLHHVLIVPNIFEVQADPHREPEGAGRTHN